MYNPRFLFKVIMLWSFQNHFISLKIDENYGHRILHICFTIFVLHWIVGLSCCFIFWQWWCFFKNVAECCFRVECADWVLMIGSSFPVVIGSNKFYFFLLKNYFGNISRFKKKKLWKWYSLEYFFTLKYQMHDNILCILNMVTKYFVGNVTSFLHRYKQNWNNI